MTSKMAARLLKYELGLQSYGDSKLKSEEEDRLAIFKPRTGFFRCGEEWHHCQQELMVSKMIVKFFS